MRILLHDYSGHPFQVQLARELARRGHHVRHLFSAVFQTPRGALQRQAGDPEGFEVAAIDPGEPFAKYSYIKRLWQERRYGHLLQRELAAFRPDVALMSNTPPIALVMPQRWCRAHGVGFVFWVQDIYAEAVARLLGQKLGPLGAPAAWLYRRLEGGLLRRSNQVVPITDDFKPLLQSTGVPDRRMTTVENWSPLDELPLRAKDNAFAREHGLHDKTVLLYSGTLGLKHNPGLLLAIAEAHRDNPSVAVVVVSEGLGASWLAERKAGLNNLHLLPFQPFDRVPDMLGAADVLLAILEPEAGIYSVPSKVLTYLCAAKPLLVAMPPENLAARTIDRQEAGVVVGPDDATGFVAAARDLIADPTRRARLGGNGRAYAERTFDVQRIGARFETILAAAHADVMRT
ncbi:glycosyltransferase family 4 protein [Reyranella sp. CPCC 100927]|uniref:glycosyltransferase family 4 protein n=1 Tax=Reyranella sp. CPCC 100927 TaxID=2599616 RepID=UPI0011B51C00|nr:glycosyltransferase family 4 protein [Reyranella sp. CPCC 100927]TWT12993.1 glycosyltransferase family 4 protein [Reyranella sp. CPCC 100927]